MLEETKGDFEQFAYVVSHDLQEQVRNITNYAGLIAKHALPDADEELRFYLEVVTGSAAKLNQMLAELLAFSRIGRNKYVEKIPTPKLLDQVLKEMGGEIAASGAKLHIGAMPQITANAAEIRLLFYNLISNALKFTGAASPEIYIECTNKSPDWEFSIKDNGIGISQNHLQKIFVIFQRLNLEEEYPGNGAGLAICKKIISWHNGRIWAESEPGEGSTFYFTLPIMEL